MSKNRLYLHIGMPKTATSALQRFFTMNRDVLERKGIAYPATGTMEAHHRFGWALKAERGFSHWWFDKDIDGYVQEWEKLNRQCVLSRNLISSETLWGINEHEIFMILELLKDYDVKIVIYMRRQDFFNESIYNERVKVGVEKRIRQVMVNPKRKIMIWERTFGKDRIIVRPFEREQFQDGSIYADFMKSVFDETLSDDYKLPTSDLNPRLHRIPLEYKRMVNHLPLTFQEKSLVVEPLQKISAFFHENSKCSDFVFSPAHRRKVVKKYQKFYSYLARDYLGRHDGSFFYAPLLDKEPWHAYEALAVSDAEIINHYLAEHAPEVLTLIVRGITEARTLGDKSLRCAAVRLSPGIAAKWFTDDAVRIPRHHNLSEDDLQKTAFDELCASRMWSMMECFRPLYDRLPYRLKKAVILGARKTYRLFAPHRHLMSQTIREPKKVLYLHIGTVKTGTTALQRFFSLNRDVLKAKGIIYPCNKDDAHAHHRVSWSFVVRDGKPKPHWPNDVQKPQQEWNYLLDQITEGAGLISSEHLVRSRIKVIRDIWKYTRDFEVKIVVYWRRRDTLEDSWHNQLTKRGDNFSRPDFREGLTSKKHLDLWADVFGKDNIIVRPYEKGQLYKGDVLADFLHHIFDLEIADGFVIPEKEVNTRLHHVALEYKRLVNHLPLSRMKKRKLTSSLNDVCCLLFEQGRKDYPVFSPAQRLELIKRYAEENAAIARHYLGRDDGQLFYDPLPDQDDEWQCYDELREEDALWINGYLAEHCPAALEIVATGILKALASKQMSVREAILRLLPGITPEVFYQALEADLHNTDTTAESRLFQEEIEQVYGSQIWKTSVILNRIYRKMPRWLQQPARECAKWFYHRV